jgi:hypothetical protein
VLFVMHPPSATQVAALRGRVGAGAAPRAEFTRAPSIAVSSVVETPMRTQAPMSVTPTAAPSPTASPVETSTQPATSSLPTLSPTTQAERPSAVPVSDALAPNDEIEEPATATSAEEDRTASATTDAEVAAPEWNSSDQAPDETVGASRSDVLEDEPEVDPSETDDEDAAASLPPPIVDLPTPPPSPTAVRVPIAVVHSPVGFSATNLRAAPGQAAASLRLLPNGTRVVLLGPYAYADGFRWVRVRTLDGLVGWAVAVAL